MNTFRKPRARPRPVLRAGGAILALCALFSPLAQAAAEDAQAVKFDRAAFAVGDYDGRFGNRSQHEVRLPHAWSVTNPGAKGDGWYTIRWNLGALPTGPQALYLTAITVPTEVYVNGILVAASGALDGPAPSSYEQSRFIDIPGDLLHLETNFIALHVRARAADVAGLGPVLAGDDDILHEHSRNALIAHTIAPAAISIATLTVGVFILMLWLRRRDSGYVMFAGGVILWSLHTLISLVPKAPLPAPHWTIAWTSLYLLFVALLCLFCIRFAGVTWRAYERFVVAYAFATMPVLYLASAFGRLDDATSWIRLGGIGIVVVALFAVARYAVRGWNLESGLLLIAGGVSTIFAMHDWLVAQNPLALRPVWLVPYAALGFLTLFGYLLTDRFVRALNESERLNVDLERRVAEKSAALSAQLQATQAAKDAAEAANRAKSSFLAAASHDLRQPLHALGMFSQALSERAHDAEDRALVQRIATSVGALETLFSALLDVSKLDAGVVTAHPRSFHVRPLLDRLVDECMPEALERGLKLGVVCGDVVVRSDPMLLERIVRNFAVNALRYTQQGGIVIGCRRREGGYAIEVWDSGAGIPGHELSRIFEEFYQIDNPGRDRSRGLGLGLAIVRRLGELLDHPIEVASREGRGSVFRVRVPAGDACAADALPASAHDLLAGRRILVIDDEPEVRAATVRLLTQWGCDAAAVPDAASALRAYRVGHAPEAMVVDFRLGVSGDGIETIAYLRERFGQRIPAVLVSGESGAEKLARIEASGIPLVHKPLPAASLRSVLAHLLAERASQAHDRVEAPPAAA